ncbi:MAG: beta-ketoacyl-[acyl-carrier-protein] synthase family protein [Planctomycetota bacterium]
MSSVSREARPNDGVVIGLGAICSLGSSVCSLADDLFGGRAAIAPFALFDTRRHRTRLAGSVTDIPNHARRHSRTDRLAVAAAREALGDRPVPASKRIGVFVGTSTGGMLEGEVAYRDILVGKVRASRLVSQPTSAPSEAVARHISARGPVESIASACAAGSMAIAAGLAALQDGEVDLALCGGADGLCELTYAGFNSLRAVAPDACRPFRADREGLSLGEGAAFLLLQRREDAERAGTPILGSVLGSGASCDSHHMTAPEPSGSGPARAIRAALDHAGLPGEGIDFINAHGTATPHNDAAEAAALRSVFGEDLSRIPVTSTKSLVGHLLGASGALEAVVTLICLRAQCVHATAGEGPVDPELGLDVVLGRARALERSRFALSTSLAFGGANAALVLGAG